MAEKKQAHLGVVALAPGAHQAAWRHPGCDPAALVKVSYFQEVARIAERGMFDLLFLADGTGASVDDRDTFERSSTYYNMEPMTVLAAISTCTKYLGLVGTISTTETGPHKIARLVGTLDHLSEGRAGWNLVTTPNMIERVVTSAAPAGKDALYARGEEVLQGVHALWDSWDDASFIRDTKSGVFASLDEARPVNIDGTYFSLHGQFNQPRPPQGHPVLFQAGASETGRNFASKFADVIFTVQPAYDLAREFYRDMKGRAKQHGRDPDQLLIMPGLSVYVGETKAEAEAYHEELQELIDPLAALSELSQRLGVDLRNVDPDQPLPDLKTIAKSGLFSSAGFESILKHIGSIEGLSVRQLARRVAGAYGHPEWIGSPAEIVDRMEEYLDNDALDGFAIIAPTYPEGLVRFVDLVVPELQRRGRLRREYSGKTLRDHLGLARPSRG